MSEKYSIVSLFCGAGGLDLGFHNSGGFKTIWANDFNKDATETMKKWCKDAKVVCGDITKIPNVIIPKADIMIGGFPCQGFSLGGNMLIDDPRNRLYKEYVRILKHVQPYCFIGENVIGLTIMDNGSVIDQIIKDFSDAGYNVTYDIVNAVDFGVAQDRERIIITGYRNDLDAKFPRPELCEHKTMRDVLLGLPEPKEDEIHMGGFSPRFMTSNRVRSWNEPSYTILAGGRNCPLHPSSTPMVLVGNREWQFGSDGKTRRLSYREAAVIQSFPYDFEFVGNLESKYKQVGNAVPPLLGEAYAKEIYKELRRLNLKGHINEF